MEFKQCLKKRGMAVLEWRVILLNLRFDVVEVGVDWHGGCIVLLYKWKGDKGKSSKSRVISFLSVDNKS